MGRSLAVIVYFIWLATMCRFWFLVGKKAGDDRAVEQKEIFLWACALLVGSLVFMAV